MLTPEAAAKAVSRIAAIRTGSKYDGYPVLGNIFWSEETASTMLGGVQIAMVMTFIDRDPTEDIETTLLPGDVWLRFVRTRSRDDALTQSAKVVLGGITRNSIYRTLPAGSNRGPTLDGVPR